MTWERTGGYQEVGKPYRCGDVHISRADVDDLRSFVTDEYFVHLPASTTLLDDLTTRSVAKVGFYDAPMYDVEATDVMTMATLHEWSPDMWRLTVKQTRTKRAENTMPQRIETRYGIDVVNDEVLEAVRKMRILRGVGDLTVDMVHEDVTEEVDGDAIQRRAYELPMEPEDCVRITEFLTRALKRAAVVKNKPKKQRFLP